MFPEMAFTGYTFKSKEDIYPYLEVSGKGITYQFLSDLAKRLNSYVVAGYPERYIFQINDEDQEELYNSMYVIDRYGKVLMDYRKHFLYMTDKT